MVVLLLLKLGIEKLECETTEAAVVDEGRMQKVVAKVAANMTSVAVRFCRNHHAVKEFDEEGLLDEKHTKANEAKVQGCIDQICVLRLGMDGLRV